MNKVTIVGSINVDNIMHIKKLPQPGETIAMSEFSKAAGGKGANQAVASSRAKMKQFLLDGLGMMTMVVLCLSNLKKMELMLTM